MRRAQVVGGADKAEITNKGKVNFITACLPRPVSPAPRSALMWRAQVDGPNAKIENTGTSLTDGSVIIIARVPRPTASEGSRRLPRAQEFSTTGSDITVSTPGKAKIEVLPASTAPARPHAKEFEPQAVGGVVTGKCYGLDFTLSAGGEKICPE